MAATETIIKPRKKLISLDMKELWEYKELFYIFAWRDIKVRYKQTALGFAWAVFQPLVSMFVFTIFFGNLAKIPSGKLPYTVFVLCGLVYWNFFSNALSRASNSLIDNQNLIKRIYFPRIILPLSAVITATVDFLISLGLLLSVLVYFGQTPSIWALIVIPVGWLLSYISASGLGLLLSAINVKYRDVRYILPFFIQLMIFLSPVIYGTNIVSSRNKLLLALNPMTGVIEAVRTAISGSTAFDFQTLIISTITALLSFILGLVYFKYTENQISDII